MTRSRSLAPAAGARRNGRAGAASFGDRAGGTPPLELVTRPLELVTRPAALEPVTRPVTAAVRDALDAERWLDEGGTLTSEAVTP